MTEVNDNLQSENQKQQLAQIKELIAIRVSQAVIEAGKKDLLSIYQKLLQTIWDCIFPTLGQVTVIAITERALVLTKENYPLIGYLRTTYQGIFFEELYQHLKEIETLRLRDSLNELIFNLIDLLTLLTGDILVQKILFALAKN